MDGSSSSDRIEFLVRRFRADILVRQVTRGEYQDTEEQRKKIKEYRAELLAKDPHELQELYKEERAKEADGRIDGGSSTDHMPKPTSYIGAKPQTGHWMRRLPCPLGRSQR
jgi:hypothetical protein